jgi:Tfp pilus assembly protein PilO
MTVNKLYITATALVLTVILAVVLLWPKYQDLQELNSTIQKKEADLQSKKDYFSHLREISQKLTEHEAGLLRVSAALPEDPSLPSLFDYFQKTASQNGLILEDIKLGGVKARKDDQERVQEIRLSLTLSGFYPDFKNFLLAIEKSARLIEVKKIIFSNPQEPEEPFSFQVDIKTHSY